MGPSAMAVWEFPRWDFAGVWTRQAPVTLFGSGLPAKSQIIAVFLLISGRHEPLEFFEPVLDEDHFGHGFGLSFLGLHHQESLAVG